MKKILLLSVAALALILVLPGPVRSATTDGLDPYVGRILIDVSSSGEAWYVNPATRMRVYLGRPAEALQRLQERAAQVNYFHVERIALEGETDGDVEYTKERAGFVLQPNDLVGAAWYVHPVLGIRMRLATPHDAWLVMQTGQPATAAVLAGIAEEPETERLAMGEAEVSEVVSGDQVRLTDGTDLRLLSVEVPANPDLQQKAVDRLITLIGQQKTVRMEADLQGYDHEGRRLRYVYARGVSLNQDLVRNGLAFHDIREPNLRYAEQLIVAGLDAMRLQRGFWQAE